MEIHTDEPKVAAIIAAWEMTKLLLASVPSTERAEFGRAEFARNYEAIATVAKIDSHQRKPGSSQG